MTFLKSSGNKMIGPIKFAKPEYDGEMRIVKNGILMFCNDDWIIIAVDE